MLEIPVLCVLPVLIFKPRLRLAFHACASCHFSCVPVDRQELRACASWCLFFGVQGLSELSRLSIKRQKRERIIKKGGIIIVCYFQLRILFPLLFAIYSRAPAISTLCMYHIGILAFIR